MDNVTDLVRQEIDLIEVEQLAKSFEDPDGNVVEAVADATLTCKAGEIYGLLGPNGAGKTTTLRCLATILTADGRHGAVAGYDLPQRARGGAAEHRLPVGGRRAVSRLTPRETLTFFGSLYGLPAGAARGAGRGGAGDCSTSRLTRIGRTTGCRRG